MTWGRGLMVLAGAGLVSPLSGQEVGAGPSGKGVEPEMLPPITVTGYPGDLGQPASVTYSVVPVSTFAPGGVEDTRSLAAVAPNVAAFEGNNSRSPRFSVRGFRENNFLAGEPVAGLYVDDVPYVDLASRGLPLFDVSGLELLRGPQGTMFGAAGPGGVWKLTTRQPEGVWHGRGTVGYGSYDHYTVQAGGGGPLVAEKLSLQLGGIWDQRDGYVDNLALGTEPDERESLAGRAQLRWTPSEAWDIAVAVDGAGYRDGFVPTYYAGHDPGYFDVRRSYDGYVDTDEFGQSLRIRHEAGALRVTAVTAHRDWQQDLRQDFDFTEYDLVYGFSRPEVEQWSQELRLESTDADARLRWVGGFFFAGREQRSDSGSTEVMPRTIALPGSPPLTLNGSTLATQAETDAFTYALYGQVTYALFEKLDLVGGVRWTRDDREMTRAGMLASPSASVGGFPIGPFAYPTAAYTVEDDFNDVQPKVGLNYHLSPNTEAYFSFATGYQSGGFNSTSDDPAASAFDPARSRHYEVGLKSACWETKLAGNVALFLIDTEDYQVHRLSAQNPTQAFVQNAESTRAMGVEVEAFYRPAEGWELNAGLGYTHAEYDRYFDPVNQVNLDGRWISFVPECTATAGVQYRFGFGLYARVDVQVLGRYPLTEDNSAEQEAFALLNARVGYEQRHWGVHLFARNLLDEEYAANALDLRGVAAPDLLIRMPGDPLTLGVAVTGKF